jgi:hypothetical protein
MIKRLQEEYLVLLLLQRPAAAATATATLMWNGRRVIHFLFTYTMMEEEGKKE